MPRSGLTCVLFTMAALALGGCNLVMSAKPVFSLADAAGAPPLRPGIWAAPDADCAFDEAKPTAAWPKCASGSVITPAEAWAVGEPEKHSPYVLASGNPRVLQAIADLSDKSNGDASMTPKGPIYLFIAVKPVAHDAQGRIIKAEAWFIQCGPPPPNPAATVKNPPGAEAYGTQHPLPGMVMDGGACTPRDKAAVRGAAAPSRAWSDEILTLHWVRDGAS